MDEPEEKESVSTAAPGPLKPGELPAQGDRALVVGQTGQGKTEFVVWILARLPSSPIVIYDTKGEPKFDRMPRSRVVFSNAQLVEAVANPEYDYIVYRVAPATLANPDAMDALLWFHFHNLRGCDVYIDELFSFTRNGQAGEGLLSLLTQGRSLGFTTIMSVQRPARISLFPLTESQHFYVFFLADKKDRIRLADVIPEFDEEPSPPEYHFYYYRQGSRERARLVAPILLDKGSEKPYKPVTEGTTGEPGEPDEPDQGTALNWI